MDARPDKRNSVEVITKYFHTMAVSLFLKRDIAFFYSSFTEASMYLRCDKLERLAMLHVHVILSESSAQKPRPMMWAIKTARQLVWLPRDLIGGPLLLQFLQPSIEGSDVSLEPQHCSVIIHATNPRVNRCCPIIVALQLSRL